MVRIVEEVGENRSINIIPAFQLILLNNLNQKKKKSAKPNMSKLTTNFIVSEELEL